MTNRAVSQPVLGPRVIFHADDFGETEEITRGIVEALQAGVLKSTSILANMPGSELALNLAPNLLKWVSFGVHINLCEGRPLTRAPSLVDASGRFLPKRELFRRSMTGRLDPEDLEREIESQVGFVAGRSIPVSHLDGHKHMHLLPGVRQAVVAVAAKFGIERVRVTAERSIRVAVSPRRTVRELIARRAARKFAAAGRRFPDRVRDLTEFLAVPPPQMARELRELSGTTEVFCHPGTAAADREKPGSCDRFRELNYLTRPELAKVLAEQEIEIISYWEV